MLVYIYKTKRNWVNFEITALLHDLFFIRNRKNFLDILINGVMQLVMMSRSCYHSLLTIFLLNFVLYYLTQAGVTKIWSHVALIMFTQITHMALKSHFTTRSDIKEYDIK